jgi:hypothetical protein
MSDIGLIMNALLGLLLVGALFVGWRLEGRLKVLRASHQSFTAAVQDLDRAAARAEQGLADLRAATDEAAETLAVRIERAGALAQRLEKLTAEAQGAEQRLAAAPRQAAALSREDILQRFSERYGAAKAAAELSPLAQAAARNDLILEDEPQARPALDRLATNDRLERLRALARPRTDAMRPDPLRPSPTRPAARLDDELFDAPQPRRMAGGAR